VIIERCEECGFDGERWTDSEAMAAIAALPAQWRRAVAEVAPDQVCDRPIPEMWSIAEYADHVREVLFGMRFLLDTALAQPGTDLGEPPQQQFDPEPRVIDIEKSLSGIVDEAGALRDRLAQLPESAWYSTVTLGGDEVEACWIARHAVHDATHHLLDVQRLRGAL
jgi:hypothetical protein